MNETQALTFTSSVLRGSVLMPVGSFLKSESLRRSMGGLCKPMGGPCD